LPKVFEPIHTDAKAAEAVGMSERQYRKADPTANRQQGGKSNLNLDSTLV
jgi:hypothetical protein